MNYSGHESPTPAWRYPAFRRLGPMIRGLWVTSQGCTVGDKGIPDMNQVSNRARGFTLVEALIAVTMTLVIMLALAQGFKRMSDDISEGRARLALSDQLRGASELLRHDVSGITVVCDPSSKEFKNGYFLYYEGPLADHHPVSAPINNLLGGGGTTEQNLSASRFGDFDDILMFTARAKSEWFRGRVPLALVKGASGGNYVPTAADWIQTVVVASEYAEIVWFAMPEIEPTSSGQTDPAFVYQTAPNYKLPVVDADTPVNPAADPIPGTASGDITGNGIPDRIRLCRRVLLILPSLNTPNGTLFNTASAAGESNAVRLLAEPITTPIGSRLSLRHAYQRCDLSVHRAQGVAVNAAAPIVANSLDDLAHPANRFAHVMLPGNTLGGSANDRSMPILSLTGPIGLQQFAFAGNLPLAAVPDIGFLNPQFLKRKINQDPASGGTILTEDDEELGATVELLTNEEVVANNCIAFDVKGFDPVAKMLYHVGSDGQPGVALADDDGNGTVDDLLELGASGSDDLEVNPSDPGYAETIRRIGVSPSAATLSQVTSRQGGFVDLAWAVKRWQPPAGLPLIDVSRIPNELRETILSGVRNNAALLSEALLKSGRAILANNGSALVFQPCFDSYTDAFERDGFRQRDLATAANAISNPTDKGTIFENGSLWFQGAVNPNAVRADLGSNGLDDDNNGLVDDFAERDSCPPILSAMPAIQALVRVEDATAGVIQQIAVTHDLATQ
jgi:hypothetical protein